MNKSAAENTTTEVKKPFHQMTREELLAVVTRTEALQEKLKRIMQHNPPAKWPLANWCFEEIHKALFNEDLWEEN